MTKRGEVVRLRTEDHAARIGVVTGTGTKWVKVVVMNGSTKLVRLPIDTEFEPVDYKGKGYPTKRAVRWLRAHGKTHGITKEAKRELRGL